MSSEKNISRTSFGRVDLDNTFVKCKFHSVYMIVIIHKAVEDIWL